jgi:EAL domain-containing protein (putative c-di-GMP-specific phosphodiesterase class I)
MPVAIVQLSALPGAASPCRDRLLSHALLGIEPALQPVVDIGSGKVLGYEALMRGFDHLGFASPIELLDHAARCGDLVPLETMLLERAIGKFAQVTQAAGKKLFLNIDSRAFDCIGTLVEAISRSAAANDVALSCICIELSERFNNTVLPYFSQTADALRRLGIGVAIDDLGTGSSELKMLCDHGIDYVKIDGHFIRGIALNRTKWLIVRTIATLAHSLGIRVIAEGVETEHDLLGCRAAGCDLAQGYFVARPTTDVATLREAYAPNALRYYPREATPDTRPSPCARVA